MKGRYRQGQKKWSGHSGVYPHHDARRLDDGVDALALGQAQVFDGVDCDDRHNVDSRSDFDGDLSIDRSHLDFSDGAGQGITGAQLHGTLQWYVRPYSVARLGPVVAASFASTMYRSEALH